MKAVQLQTLTEEIVVVLYDRTVRFGHPDWDLDSAFKAMGRTDSHELKGAVLSKLLHKGWVTTREQHLVQGDPLAVCLTERGKFAAITLLELSEPKSLLDKVHAMHWATWGSLAAVVAALASIAAAIFAYEAL